MSDTNTLSFAGERPLRFKEIGDLIAAPGHSDTLKITDCADGFVKAGHIVGGLEDCVDVNNKTMNVTVHAWLFEPRGKYLSTIKGASGEITLRGDVKGHGSEVDVDIGNVSDQSDNVTGRVYLDLKHIDGDPITVRILNGVRPVFLNSSVQRYDIVFAIPGFWRSLFSKAYKFLKRIGIPI